MAVGILLWGQWHRQGLAQALTLPGSVHGRGRHWSQGQAKPLDFRGKIQPINTSAQGVISVRAGDIRRKVPTVRAHEACSDRLFPWASRKLGESRCSSQGGFLWMLLDFSLWEPGTRSPVSISPGGAAPAATCCCAKQGFSLSKFCCFPVFLLCPIAQLVLMEKAGRAGWMCPSHTSWLVLKNRGSCWRRAIHNPGGFGTILPELRKENKACVGKLWHRSNLRCLEDHSSFLWIYPWNLKIGLVFSATCMFHFYLSALCLGNFPTICSLFSLFLLRSWVFSVL